MLLNLKRCVVMGLLAASYTTSASVWSPTTSDIDFFAFGPFGGWTKTGNIGIFEDTGSLAPGNLVAEFSNGATVSFAPNGWDWAITVASTGAKTVTKTLSGSTHFQLGWRLNGAWIPETGKNLNPWTPNFWQLTFIDSSLAHNNTETLYVTNVRLSSPIVENALPPIPTPLPAAAWSFMAGTMGLLALGKRRHQ